jgi:hypothetical protein
VRELPGLEVRRDGARLDPTQWSAPLPINKGSHTIEATAPGRQRWERTIEIRRDGDKESIEIDALAEAIPPPTPTLSAPPRLPIAITSRPPPPPRAKTGSPRATRTAGIVLSVVGAAGVGVGAVSGALAKVKKSDSDAYCNGDVCDQRGFDLRMSARTAGNVSTAMFIAGGTLLAGGVTLFVLAPSNEEPRAKVLLGPLGAHIQYIF